MDMQQVFLDDARKYLLFARRFIETKGSEEIVDIEQRDYRDIKNIRWDFEAVVAIMCKPYKKRRIPTAKILAMIEPGLTESSIATLWSKAYIIEARVGLRDARVKHEFGHGSGSFYALAKFDRAIDVLRTDHPEKSIATIFEDIEADLTIDALNTLRERVCFACAQDQLQKIREYIADRQFLTYLSYPFREALKQICALRNLDPIRDSGVVLEEIETGLTEATLKELDEKAYFGAYLRNTFEEACKGIAEGENPAACLYGFNETLDAILAQKGETRSRNDLLRLVKPGLTEKEIKKLVRGSSRKQRRVKHS